MRLITPFLMLACLVHTPAAAVNEMPAYLIRLPDSVRTVFVAETSAAAFHRFDNNADMKIDYQGTHYMSIGENGDGKRNDGDRRTPLGIYFVTEQLDTEKLHEKYGVTAFTLDYPNAWDRRMQRTGDGIWVHGVDRRGGKRPALDTDGCIALPNEILTKLANGFQPNVTPVLIARELKWVDRSRIEALRVRLDAAVARWAESLQHGDMHAYLSLYDDEFRHWGMNKTEWTVFSIDNLGSRSIEKVTVSDLLLLADPVEGEIYLSRFRLGVTEGTNTVEVTKRLYWHVAVSGDLKILAEDSG